MAANKFKGFILVVAVAYGLLGLMWAPLFGINGMELRDSRTLYYSHVITAVQSAEFDGEVLWLCVNGRQMHHSANPAEANTYSIAIPLTRLWNGDDTLHEEGFRRSSNSNRNHEIGLPLRQVAEECRQPEPGAIELPVTELAETEDIGDFFDGYNRAELQRLVDDRPIRQEILLIPRSFNSVNYSESRQLVYVGSDADVLGNQFIDIRVRPQQRDREIGAPEAFGALLMDAVTFPYQLYMWIEYAGAH